MRTPSIDSDSCRGDLVLRDRGAAVKVLMDKRRTGRRQGQKRSGWGIEFCMDCRGWHIYPTTTK
jgi:hypothetical protein